MKNFRNTLLVHVIPIALMICFMAYAMILVNQQLH